MGFARAQPILRVLALHRKVAAVADHGTARLAELAGDIGARLLLVMDGDRQAIYRGDSVLFKGNGSNYFLAIRFSKFICFDGCDCSITKCWNG